MNKYKKIISIVLVMVLSCGMFLYGCGQQAQTDVSKDDTGNNEFTLENVGIDMETAIPTLEKPTATDFKLVENGNSSYKIVVPKESTEFTDYAAEELQYFMKEATGVELAIVRDEEVTDADVIISLGATSVANTEGVTVAAEDALGVSGYKIKTVGDNIFILGDAAPDSEGVLYGVYDFLLDAIDLKVYTSDEIAFTESENVPLYAYDDIVKPAFDERSLCYYDLRMDHTYMRRMRLFDFYDTEKWALFGHSQVSQILPFTEEHTDWYCPGGGQLCWAAGDEMEQAFAANLIEKIKENTTATYFMLGQEDTSNLCSCDKCLAATSSDMYGSYTGLQVAFLNDVIEIVEKWREANQPDREIRYVCFAYSVSLLPPVKEDADGNFAPYHEDCVPADELYVMFAPIEADFSKELQSEENKRTYNALLGWKSLVEDRIFVYEYETNFKAYFMNINNFEVVQEHYQTYLDQGVQLMYSQGPVTTYIPAFTEMRIFVESQLMWDIDKDYNDLVNEFMAVYFKDAAPAMRKYYDFIRQNYSESQETGRIYSFIDQPEYYSFETMQEMEGYIEEALEAIEPLRNTDNELFSTLYYRIKKESMSVLWLQLQTFNLYYEEDELDKIALEFYYLKDMMGLEQYAEGQDVSDMFFGYIKDFQ